MSPLPPLRRLAGTALSAVLGFLASPGVSGRDGSLVLAVLCVATWAWTVAHPLGERPWRGRAAEWLGGALAGGLMMWWVTYVVFFGVLYIAAGWGVYFVVMGAALRLLARRSSFPLAVALVWTGVELVRALVPPPFGLGWFRLGYHAHAHLWLSGGVRAFGLEGLTFVVAALGGGVAALARERRARAGLLVASLLPLAVCVLAATLTAPPPTVDGPRVLLVQPGFTQQRKQHADPVQNLLFSRDLTHRALAEAGPVDLVCWGESMLYVWTFSPAAAEALHAGSAVAPPWWGGLTAEDVDAWAAAERRWVEDEIMGLAGSTPPFQGAALAVGTEHYDVAGGALRRHVALFLYDGSGRRSEPALKRFLVPLGETFFGLERFGWVRALAQSSAGYIPDLVPGTETGRLELEGRDGRSWRVGGTICFDNAHPWPYLDAVRGEPVDFHLVVSNEAWYETSCEMDQMIAFSRVFALMTGRAIVRATNSGVSAVLGPDGRELGRVRDAAGEDRAVAGFGAWTVPVPASGAASVPPYVRWSRSSEALWLALLAVRLLRALRRGNRAAAGG
ncbi:MAG TPA: apolipoprotein N-acyltransferase [Planctomycetota bacterium]